MSLKSILIYALAGLGGALAAGLAFIALPVLLPLVIALMGLVALAYLEPRRMRFLNQSELSKRLLPAALRTSPVTTALAIFAVGIPAIALSAGIAGSDNGDEPDVVEPVEIAAVAAAPTEAAAAPVAPSPEAATSPTQAPTATPEPTPEPTSTPVEIAPTPAADMAAYEAIAEYWGVVEGQIARVTAANDVVQSVAPADVLADPVKQEELYPAFDEMIAVYDEALAIDEVPEGFFASWHEDYLDVVREFDEAAYAYDRTIGTGRLADAERALARMADARALLDDLQTQVQYK